MIQAGITAMNAQVWEEMCIFTPQNELENKRAGEMYSLLPSVLIH